jgi:hypothetical protein
MDMSGTLLRAELLSEQWLRLVLLVDIMFSWEAIEIVNTAKVPFRSLELIFTYFLMINFLRNMEMKLKCGLFWLQLDKIP